MPYHNTVLCELMNFLPRARFEAFVGQHKGDAYVKHFTCWNQLTVLLYAQISGKDSLLEIETGMGIWDSRFYHLGLTSVKRNTLSNANKKRSYKIFEKLFYAFLKQCKFFTPEETDWDIENPLYALDSTVIDVCLSLFPWAKFRKRKGGLKAHTLLEVKNQIPVFLVITNAKEADIKIAKKYKGLTKIPKGSIITIDRGYTDYGFLYDLHKRGITFVIRKKKKALVLPIEKRVISEEEKASGVLKDERVEFISPKAEKAYPEAIRLITYHDKEHDVLYEFFTNNFELPAKTIADIYKHRWQVELFFRWIKQNLKIKTFLGTSENAVLTQIWVAMICYLLLFWIKRQTKFNGSLTQLNWILREALLQDTPLLNLLRLTPKTVPKALKQALPEQFTLF